MSPSGDSAVGPGPSVPLSLPFPLFQLLALLAEATRVYANPVAAAAAAAAASAGTTVTAALRAAAGAGAAAATATATSASTSAAAAAAPLPIAIPAASVPGGRVGFHLTAAGPLATSAAGASALASAITLAAAAAPAHSTGASAGAGAMPLPLPLPQAGASSSQATAATPPLPLLLSHVDVAALALHAAAVLSRGLSGRALRKLPLQAHARHVRSGAWAFVRRSTAGGAGGAAGGGAGAAIAAHKPHSGSGLAPRAGSGVPLLRVLAAFVQCAAEEAAAARERLAAEAAVTAQRTRA